MSLKSQAARCHAKCTLASYLLRFSNGGRGSGQTRLSSSSSVWTTRPPSTGVSGEAQTIEQLWEQRFADPSLWSDFRIDKRIANSPDFEKNLTKQPLWIDGRSTPSWVKAMLELDSAHPNSFPGSNKGKPEILPGNERDLRRNGESGDGNLRRQPATTSNQALASLKRKLERGIAVDPRTYVEVLKRCAKERNVVGARFVHDCVSKSGIEQNLFVANSLLSVYMRCGRLGDAQQVFDKLVTKSVRSWTIMIGGYALQNHALYAMELFNKMRQEGFRPDEFAYVSILKACASASHLNWAKDVHEDVKRAGFESKLHVGSALLHVYAKNGSITEARRVFAGMEERDVVVWNIMIGAYADSGRGEEAYRLFLQMKEEGFKPDAVTYLSILSARASAGALEWVKEVHSDVVEAGLESDLRVGSALVHMYIKSGSIDDARLVFDRLEKRNLITWKVMIGAYADRGRVEAADNLVLQMNLEGFN